MNVAHTLLCRSSAWERHCTRQVVPWVLDGVSLGDSVLEIGPGYGANVAALTERAERVTVAELDPVLAARLRERGSGVEVVTADGAALPMGDKTFTAVTCFTMLHHVPTVEQQDRVFDEAFRVLRPGGVLAGCDGLDSLGMRVLHIGDTFNPLDVGTLKGRLSRAGFDDVQIERRAGQVRIRASRPG